MAVPRFIHVLVLAVCFSANGIGQQPEQHHPFLIPLVDYHVYEQLESAHFVPIEHIESVHPEDILGVVVDGRDSDSFPSGFTLGVVVDGRDSDSFPSGLALAVVVDGRDSDSFPSGFTLNVVVDGRDSDSFPSGLIIIQPTG